MLEYIEDLAETCRPDGVARFTTMIGHFGQAVNTISFLFSTPGVAEAAGGGFPALSSTGQFLLKDVVLLGVSLWTLADTLRG